MEATASTLVIAASACEHMFEAGRGGAQNGDGMADEQPPYVPIVREPELQRLAAAGRAVLAELSRLHDAVGHRPDLLAGLYAARALVADDEHGWRHGLVVQADSLRWTELERLADGCRILARGLPAVPGAADRRSDPGPLPVPDGQPATLTGRPAGAGRGRASVQPDDPRLRRSSY